MYWFLTESDNGDDIATQIAELFQNDTTAVVAAAAAAALGGIAAIAFAAPPPLSMFPPQGVPQPGGGGGGGGGGGSGGGGGGVLPATALAVGLRCIIPFIWFQEKIIYIWIMVHEIHI